MDSGNSNFASDAEQSGASDIIVKIEPGSDFGEEEATVAEGLYKRQEIKIEVVIGPEPVELQDIDFSSQHGLAIKEDEQHKLKSENGANAASEHTHSGPENGPYNRSTEQQYELHGREVRSGLVLRKLEPVDGGVGNIRPRGLPARCQVHSMEHQPKSNSQTNLKHLQTIKIEKPLKCNLCDQWFQRQIDLNRHIRVTHKGEKAYSCCVCNKGFAHKSALTCHIRIHTGEKPYRCNVCDKRFTKPDHLTTHILVHTGEKPYNCHVCNKPFAHKSALTCHIRIHTGEKPYICDVCNKRFRRLGNLNSHTLVHTGEKLYKCDVCEKRFVHKGALIPHMRIHTGEKPFSCDVCKKRFTKFCNLTSHTRVHR